MPTPPVPLAALRQAVKALVHNNGNKRAAAREIGMACKTYRERLDMAEDRGIKIPKFETPEEKIEKARMAILEAYATEAKKAVRHLTYGELAKVGFTVSAVRQHFRSMGSLRDAAKTAFPDAFKEVIDDLYSPKRFAALKAEVEKHKRFVITTAVVGCEVHEGFMASLKNWCCVHDAALLILTASDPASHKDEGLDPSLADELILTGNIQLNRNIFISGIQLGAKHMDPITGLGRIGQRNGSFVYASPKQRLKLIPNSNTKLPLAIMTTGAITLPDYAPAEDSKNAHASLRTAYIAEHDHVIGAVIVEVENKHRFHYRQVQADEAGRFADLGKLYSPTKVTPFAPEALILGDWHAGETDPTFRRCMLDAKDSVRAVCRPRTVILHDLFDGKSINHHEMKNQIRRAQLAALNKLDLRAELHIVADDLNAMCEYFEEVIIVKSNHDEFLERYLADGGHLKDPQNTEIGCELTLAAIRGGDALRAAVEPHLKHPTKVRWLQRDEDYKVAGIQLDGHGDKGANGSRGSLRAMENAYGQSVSGHAHTPEILRGAFQVGTGCRLRQNYNRGPSSWLLSSCLLYASGSRQLVNVIENAWRLN